MADGKITLPEKYDPYDMRLKVQFHPKADKMNVIATLRKNPGLCCGARTGDKICHNGAGKGTSHPGYGRCRIHGGCATGPKTEEGKRRSSQNNIKHGLYMKTLLPGEENIFNQLNTEDDPKSLAYEINVLKTKIIAYLMRNRDRYTADCDKYDEETAYNHTKVWYNDGESRNRYHMATIEDPALDRALRTLRSLVETHNRLDGNTNETDLMDVLNKELKAASQGQIAISWGGEAQNKAEK